MLESVCAKVSYTELNLLVVMDAIKVDIYSANFCVNYIISTCIHVKVMILMHGHISVKKVWLRVTTVHLPFKSKV